MLGEDGVAKRVDAFAMAIQMRATIYDLEEAELCYAPPFGSAKDPVNFAGMVAGNLLRGDMPIVHWDGTGGGVPARRAQSAGTGGRVGAGRGQHPAAAAARAPRRTAARPEILVICRSAVRAYYATRILLQNGFTARNISGGMLARSHRAE